MSRFVRQTFESENQKYGQIFGQLALSPPELKSSESADRCKPVGCKYRDSIERESQLMRKPLFAHRQVRQLICILHKDWQKLKGLSHEMDLALAFDDVCWFQA